jgi:hypothetical protein
MYILPYNFPALFSIFQGAQGAKVKKATLQERFQAYLKNIPVYYYKPLQDALRNLKFAYLWPTNSTLPAIIGSINKYNERLKEQVITTNVGGRRDKASRIKRIKQY